MLPRIPRLLAVARYEMHSHMTGRPALRLFGVAAVLLLPAGLIPTPHIKPNIRPTAPILAPLEAADPVIPGPPPPPKVLVRGSVPAFLDSRVEVSEYSPYEMKGEHPVVLVATEVTRDMRAALETIEGPVRLEVRDYHIPTRLPGRSLLIAILAISLLTGPLADALPGERARRTLEVLLTAGITRGELTGGKWLAWTLSASASASVSAALACWRGVQEPGWWLAGIPLFIGSAVAFGLWLVRLVDDVVGGSAAPMRVLPVAAGTMAAIARGLSGVSPLAAAAVPLGGPLLLAANLLTTPSAAAAATVGTAIFVAGALTLTGRDLDRADLSATPTRWGAIGLCAVATLLWWLTVGGPGVWGGGGSGTSDLVTALPHSILVGALALLACAAIAIAREPGTQRPLRSRGAGAAKDAAGSFSVLAAAAVIAVGSALAWSGALPHLDLAAPRPTIEVMLDRLKEGGLPGDVTSGVRSFLVGALTIFAHTFLFRAVVAKKAGWLASSAMWSVAVAPWAPWSALAGSCALGALAERFGWMAAFAAHLLWSVGASAGTGSEGGALPALAGQAIALAISLTALKLVRGEPSRHQL